LSILTSTVGLILTGHGSEFGAYKEILEQLSAIVRARSPFLIVQVGFVEMCSPSLHDALASAIEAGAEKIIVVPVLLSESRHTTQDIPKLLGLEKGRTRGTVPMGARSVEVVTSVSAANPNPSGRPTVGCCTGKDRVREMARSELKGGRRPGLSPPKRDEVRIPL